MKKLISGIILFGLLSNIQINAQSRISFLNRIMQWWNSKPTRSLTVPTSSQNLKYNRTFTSPSQTAKSFQASFGDKEKSEFNSDQSQWSKEKFQKTNRNTDIAAFEKLKKQRGTFKDFRTSKSSTSFSLKGGGAVFLVVLLKSVTPYGPGNEEEVIKTLDTLEVILRDKDALGELTARDLEKIIDTIKNYIAFAHIKSERLASCLATVVYLTLEGMQKKKYENRYLLEQLLSMRLKNDYRFANKHFILDEIFKNTYITSDTKAYLLNALYVSYPHILNFYLRETISPAYLDSRKLNQDYVVNAYRSLGLYSSMDGDYKAHDTFMNALAPICYGLVFGKLAIQANSPLGKVLKDIINDVKESINIIYLKRNREELVDLLYELKKETTFFDENATVFKKR